MGRKKTEFELELQRNNYTLAVYQDKIRLLATSIFDWENLDKMCGVGAAAFLENALFETGKACIVYDKTKGFLCLNANPQNKFNIYGLPTKVAAYSNSVQYNEIYDFDDIVYIRNNNQDLSTIYLTMMYAYKLYNTDRAIDVNINAQKTPVLIECDTQTRLTLEQLYKDYSGNMPFIFGNKKFDLSGRISSIKTEAPYLADKLLDYKQRVFNEMLTNLGIDNTNTEKKERLITDEVNSNSQLVGYYLNAFYQTRKQAAEQINEKFLKDKDYKIEVKINTEAREIIYNNLDTLLGGELNGTLYDNDSEFNEE